ncbi:glycerophosphodiester phosphodiesterase family protein [Dokdonella sp.]|uniref:glycerophosphodiester phosphodiesterase family protein n=1 Tax=Dokdonella sp. TaxID=2291710 RepID=UPI0035288B0E
MDKAWEVGGWMVAQGERGDGCDGRVAQDPGGQGRSANRSSLSLSVAPSDGASIRESGSVEATWLFNDKVQVIAHRGASAWHPEHTLAAYARAIEDGADFIEPDLVLSRDGVLIARHENEIGASTDVAAHPRFAGRRTRKLVDGQILEGWFCEDFSVDELGSLKAREPLSALRSRAEDHLHGIATLDDIVELASRKSASSGRRIGLIPELKHSSYFHSIGLDPELALLSAWERHETLRAAPFGIQSFEIDNLRRLRAAVGKRSGNVFLVQLIGDPATRPFDRNGSGKDGPTYADMIGPEGLASIADYADVVAAHKRMIVPVDLASEAFTAPTSLVRDAHAAGLAVHAWTLRPENHFLPPFLRGSDRLAERCESGAIEEMSSLIDAGVDGLFTDDPALGRLAVDRRSGLHASEK